MAPARQLLGNLLMIDDDDEMEEEESKKNEEATIGPFWQKNKKKLTSKNKINQLIRISRDKYICLDWDKCRYFTWDKKRKSIALLKNR
jgi:hypothetical protein